MSKFINFCISVFVSIAILMLIGKAFSNHVTELKGQQQVDKTVQTKS